MIAPEDIRAQARKLWASGFWLRAALGDAPIFPYAIAFRRPSAREWLDRYAELRSAVEVLEAESKRNRGWGYAVHYREVSHRTLGMQRVPDRIVLDSVEDAAACAGESEALAQFRSIGALLRSSEPALLEWLSQRPLLALEEASAIPQLLDVVRYLREHPRPGVFVREIGVPGVDTKFMEAHRGVLRDWLDRLLPADVIDREVGGFTDHGFERRYGFRYEEPTLRFRWLDPSRLLAAGISDAAVPLSQFRAHAPDCVHVFVTENKVSYLTLPACDRALAVFGAGYAIENLFEVPWLGRCRLHYWGDIDTHGFSILHRLRTRWPHVESFLMDRETLMLHQAWWTEEPGDARCIISLPALNAQEGALYRDLCDDRLGVRVRLEQERIGFDRVTAAVREIPSAAGLHRTPA